MYWVAMVFTCAAMLGEILLLTGVREHNRPLWLRGYPFHGGLYLLVTFVLLLGVGAFARIREIDTSRVSLFAAMTDVEPGFLSREG